MTFLNPVVAGIFHPLAVVELVDEQVQPAAVAVPARIPAAGIGNKFELRKLVVVAAFAMDEFAFVHGFVGKSLGLLVETFLWVA